MKLKLVFFSFFAVMGIYTAVACSKAECGGGNDKCCKDVFGALYYTKAE